MYNLIPNDTEFSRKNEICQKLNIHFDVMASGPFVLKTDNFLDTKAKSMNHKIMGFEMESYGVFRTFELLGKDKLCLLVKSVMDYTDSKKKDVNNSAKEDINSVSLEAIEEVPKGENIKNMASYFSSICVRALLPHISDYIKTNNL